MPRPVGRRAEIHETFIRHVAERGYEATNLGDIADELGMSKGTIVHHFGTKAQMLRELEENYMRRQLDAVDQMWETLHKPQERIAAFLFMSARLQVVARDATVATQREVVQLSEDPEMQEVRKIRQELQQRTVEEVQRGVDDGAFRELDPHLVALQLFGSVQWMWVWFDPAGRLDADAVASSFVDVFLSGLLSNRAGAKALADPEGKVAATVRSVITAESA
jgi:AcrR family transcriptional regulator